MLSSRHRSADEKTPLHFAAYYSPTALVTRLLTAGADVNARDAGERARGV
jgi:ankyrin repeat protein